MRIGFFIAVLTALAQVLCAQSSFLPKTLGLSVNSLYDEINPVVSPDGKTLYFVRVNHPENTYGARDSEDIWYSTRVNDSTWGEAIRLPDLNIGRYNAVLSVSADGNSLLLNGVYNHKGKIWKKRGFSISEKVEGRWSVPVMLRVSAVSHKNRGMRSSGSLSPSGNTLLLSYSKVYNGERNDIYYSTRKDNGKFHKPRKVRALNTRFNEETPFLSADGKTLYFASDRGAKGKFNIYKSVRQDDGWKKWSTPVMLSDTINTAGWESYFRTNLKGSWAFYASTNKSPGNADLFTVKLFEENPFVIVSGSVVNGRTGAVMSGRNYVIKVDGKQPDSLRVDTGAGTYEVKLPLRHAYKLHADLENFVPSVSQVDVSRQREFTTMRMDLKVEPLPYVLVKGKVVVRNTEVPQKLINLSVLIDDHVVDSLIVDALTGAYHVKLPHGASYRMAAQAYKHEPVVELLDLSAISEYQEIERDLYLEEEKMAVVSGRVLDKKTGQPLVKLSAARIIVEGMSSVLATIDTLTGTYEVKLPFGLTYTISASAPKYYPVFESVDLAVKAGNERVSRDLVIVPIEIGQSIRLNNIFFDAGKSVLKPLSFPELDRVVEFMTNNPDIKIEIAGHTDNVGKTASNLKLSQNRAKSVMDYVVKKGIAKARVVSKGYGSSKPVASNKTKDGKAQNRRVEFTILDN